MLVISTVTVTVTVSKQFQNCFVSVSFRCADSLTPMISWFTFTTPNPYAFRRLYIHTLVIWLHIQQVEVYEIWRFAAVFPSCRTRRPTARTEPTGRRESTSKSRSLSRPHTKVFWFVAILISVSALSMSMSIVNLLFIYYAIRQPRHTTYYTIRQNTNDTRKNNKLI